MNRRSVLLVMTLSLCLAFLPPALFAAEPGSIIDFEGAEFGAAVPRWVLDVDAGDYKRLKKDMRLAAEVKVWIVPVKGATLDFASAWIDSMDIVSLVVTDVQKAALEAIAAEPKLSPEEKGRLTRGVSEEMQYLSVNGLEKTTAFWLSRQQDDGVEYTYYAVFTMRKDVWSRQVAALLENIEGLPPRVAKNAAAAVNGITVIADATDSFERDLY